MLNRLAGGLIFFTTTMNWKIKWIDGTISFWPQSLWTAEELVKMVKIKSFELTHKKAA